MYVVAAQCLIAVRFPNFATVLSVIGCVCATVSIFFLPCLFHMTMSLRADGAPSSARELLVSRPGLAAALLFDVLLIMFGVVGMVAGLAATLTM